MTGRVAEEELVEKAVIKAGPIARKWRHGFTLADKFQQEGKGDKDKYRKA